HQSKAQSECGGIQLCIREAAKAPSIGGRAKSDDSSAARQRELLGGPDRRSVHKQLYRDLPRARTGKRSGEACNRRRQIKSVLCGVEEIRSRRRREINRHAQIVEINLRSIEQCAA